MTDDAIPTISHREVLQCPYCWQKISFIIEVAYAHQEMVEDCPKCCSPVMLDVRMADDGEITVYNQGEDD